MTVLNLLLPLLTALLGVGFTWLLLRRRVKERQEQVAQETKELEQSRLLLKGAEERLIAAKEHTERLEARLAEQVGRENTLRDEVTSLTAQNARLAAIAEQRDAPECMRLRA